jgi:hypothetical protein
MSSIQEQAYLAQLSPLERIAVDIARSHLESSFSLVKSIGFQNWLKTRKPEPKANILKPEAKFKAGES